jgi:hypothetical protein
MTDANGSQEHFERRLRKARHDVFSDDEEVSKAASAEIDACKIALAPYWDARAENAKHAFGQRFLYMTE